MINIDAGCGGGTTSVRRRYIRCGASSSPCVTAPHWRTLHSTTTEYSSRGDVGAARRAASVVSEAEICVSKGPVESRADDDRLSTRLVFALGGGVREAFALGGSERAQLGCSV